MNNMAKNIKGKLEIWNLTRMHDGSVFFCSGRDSEGINPVFLGIEGKTRRWRHNKKTRHEYVRDESLRALI